MVAAALVGGAVLMRAVVHSRRVKPAQREFREDYAKPAKPGIGQLLVRVHAAAINPVDYKLPLFITNGKIVGLDFSGVVEEVGASVDGSFTVGTEVFGSNWGCLAEYALVDSTKVAVKPPTLSHKQAAALPTVYLTSLQSLRAGGLKEGGTVLIVGASGGCGLAGVQLAKGMGAKEIVGVCSGANVELVKAHGCTDVIDYKTETVANRFASGYFDMSYDTATNSGGGEDYMAVCRTATKPSGMVVAINGFAMLWLRTFLRCPPKNTKLVITNPSRADLETILELLRKSNATPVIDSVHPFTVQGVESAFDRLHSRRSKGKVVIDVVAT